MADSYVPILDSLGVARKLDTDQVTVGANVVERERNRLAGGADDELADVRNADPAANDYGAVIRAPDGGIVTLGATDDAAWNGSDAAPSIVAILKYLVAKDEAVRALLAGSLTVGLPSGAATQTTLAAVLAAVDGIEGLLAALPLPTGAATQTTLAAVLAAVTAATPAGTNLIGKVGIDQTTPGTTNAVADAGPALAGTTTYTTSADMTAVADIGPAPTSGQKSVLREVTVSVDTAMNVTLQMQTTAGAERIKYYLPANGTVTQVFRHPRKLGTADKKWQAIASVVGNVAISTVTTSEA